MSQPYSFNFFLSCCCFFPAYSKFFHENSYTPDTVTFNCRYQFFLVGAGENGKEIGLE